MHPLEQYLRELRATRGIGTDELSGYPALRELLAGVGADLSPQVRCVMNPAGLGSGDLPDGGLYVVDQVPDEDPQEWLGRVRPARGAVEVKSLHADARTVADSEQVRRYARHYRLVLVTNYRDFLLVRHDPDGPPQELDRFTLAPDPDAFWTLAEHPRRAATERGTLFLDFLRRVLLTGAPLADPGDLAWTLASFAREALARVAAADRGMAGLANIRTALQTALGIEFREDEGEHFFESTLVQTLFYGVFSAWVLWARERPPTDATPFNWHETAWHLRVPMINVLFQQAASPAHLRSLRLDELLDRAGHALNRVDRDAFFQAFREEHAVQYFYEPFLQAYDPELRRQLGVWYTPPEVVEYMVRRVDRALEEELGIEDGLADPDVYVLDPCCGTGAYLVEVLRQIGRRLERRGTDGLSAHDIKQAAVGRVFGFELIPAPYVVAHLQLGLHLRNIEAPLGEGERAGVYLTNALTGWEPPKGPKQVVQFPEMEEEREAAAGVKQETPILVILGNPPYNGFAGMAVGEERDLSDAYRTTRRAPAPQGQGLNDLFVRFFRMAERRIVEKSGRGIVCFISNYAWLDGLSFTGMRERYLDGFHAAWIDCLNGDKYKTGKTTPDGQPDPSVFSTEFNREGIQVGTAVATLVRRGAPTGPDEPADVRYRDFWGRTKRADLLEAGRTGAGPDYETVPPHVEIGYPFRPMDVDPGYLSWPTLPELMPTSFPGVKTSRDGALVDIDRDRLVARMERYLDPDVPDDVIREEMPELMASTRRFDGPAVRRRLLEKGFVERQVVRYAYRPFDLRWLYWEPTTKLLDEKRSSYVPHVMPGNVWVEARQKVSRTAYDHGCVTRVLADNLGSGLSSYFPAMVRKQGALQLGPLVPNLSAQATQYVECLGTQPQRLLEHAAACVHACAYRAENLGALVQDWPRIPLPASKEALEASAALGSRLADLLDPERPADAVTRGTVRPELAPLGRIDTVTGNPLDPAAGHLDLEARWGYAGRGGICMPGPGRTDEHPVELPDGLGGRAVDVYLNDHALWRDVPLPVWEYTLGGYQVLKKWLSYRERDLLGRALTVEEARYFGEMVRRIAAILLLGPELDANYRRVKADTWPWPGAAGGD